MMGNLATLLADLGDALAARAPATSPTRSPSACAWPSRSTTSTPRRPPRSCASQANEVDGRGLRAGRLHHRRHQPGPGVPGRGRRRAAPRSSFLDWAKSSDVARYAFRGVLFGVRLASDGAPEAAVARCSTSPAGSFPDLVNMGALTIISNIYGNPAVSIPAGTVDGLPVGMQVLGPPPRDALLFDVALAVERERPWPLVAPPVVAAAT